MDKLPTRDELALNATEADLIAYDHVLDKNLMLNRVPRAQARYAYADAMIAAATAPIVKDATEIDALRAEVTEIKRRLYASYDYSMSIANSIGPKCAADARKATEDAYAAFKELR